MSNNSQSMSNLSSVSCSVKKETDIAEASLDHNHSFNLHKKLQEMLKDSEIPYQPLILGSLVINSQIYLKNCIIKYRQILQYKKNLVLNGSKIVSLQNESSQSMMNFVEQARDAPLDMFQVSWVDQSIKCQKRQNSLSDNELLHLPNRRSHS